MDTSENGEAAIVLGATVAAAATTYIAALPIPLEIKTPTITLTGSIATAIFLYWKTRVNKQTPK